MSFSFARFKVIPRCQRYTQTKNAPYASLLLSLGVDPLSRSEVACIYLLRLCRHLASTLSLYIDVSLGVDRLSLNSSPVRLPVVCCAEAPPFSASRASPTSTDVVKAIQRAVLVLSPFERSKHGVGRLPFFRPTPEAIPSSELLVRLLLLLLLPLLLLLHFSQRLSADRHRRSPSQQSSCNGTYMHMSPPMISVIQRGHIVHTLCQPTAIRKSSPVWIFVQNFAMYWYITAVSTYE